MVGRRLQISSSGKHLVFAAGRDKIALHLGMTGQFRLAPIPEEYEKHHFMTLRWRKTECCFLDFRRFARARMATSNPMTALGGFDPARGFFLKKASDLVIGLSHLPGWRSTPRIAWLLRHGSKTGVGNYLANEALGRLRLTPFEPCNDESEALVLLKACQRLARRSFQAGGTSFGIGYFRLDGSEGTFASQLAFYRRPGIKRSVFQNRSVYTQFPGQLRSVAPPRHGSAA